MQNRGALQMTLQATVAKTSYTVRGKEYPRYLVRYLDESTGKRTRKVFSTLAEARRFAERCNRDAGIRDERQTILQKRIGEDAAKLSADVLHDAVAALATLAGRGSLQDAASHYVRYLQATANDAPTVSELMAAYMENSEAQGLRPRSLSDLRVRLGRFARAFGSRKVNSITSADVNGWLDELKRPDGKRISPLTRQHYRFAVGGMLNFAIDRDYITGNPVAPKTRSRRSKGSNKLTNTAEILSPAQVRAIMDAAVEHVPAMIAPLALGFFAGVRTAEINRLEWDRHVVPSKGLISITADIAKRRSVRNITIADLPRLAKWLALTPETTGRVAPFTERAWRDALELVREKAGITHWPHNAMRHSFASYHLQHFSDAGKTSLILGHSGGTALLFEHHKALTTSEAAAEYWSIAPPS